MIRFLIFLGCTVAVTAAPRFEFRDGDRVAFLGDGFIEREQYEGWIEMAATTHFADRAVTFRNLGWSGDLPDGASRCGLSLLQAGMEPPEEGWRQLQNQLKTYQPNVLVTGYGMAASLPGGPTPEEFRKDFERLLDEAKDMRVLVLGAPPRFPHAGDTDEEVKAHVASLAAIDAVLREVAEKRGLPFVSLQPLAGQKDLSDNGIHLNSAGYRAAARLIEKELGWGAGKWEQGKPAVALRRAILRKNEWFFHRSRPANMAYIFGFRKAEQGRNAGEILAFDKLVAEEEGRIAEMRSLSKVVAEPKPRTTSAVAAHTPQPHPEFTVADGYEISLWAENPLLYKPTQMNFDSKGRLWVASAETYPQVEVGQTADDKILILEDRDGDGKAEKSTAFATGLLMPTGLLPTDDGCYVGQSTDLLYFRDTDGDGKADVKQRVLSGFGTEDTHHNIHTLRRGPDGKIWFNQSIYTRSDAETPHGVMRLKSGGVMKFDPRSNKLDTVFFGWCNAWGHQFDRYGQSFMTDGAGGGGINWGVPGAMYFTYARAPKTLDSISPGSYPKFCGLEIVESPHFPQGWQGSMITCDFRAHRIVRFAISEQGSGYAAQEVGDIVRSNSVSFRPIDAKIGPDGALYIADWSNPIINHGEVDFRDPRRDREHGRIWRVTRKAAAKEKVPDFTKLPESSLLTAMTSPHRHHRDVALAEFVSRPESQKKKDAAEKWLGSVKDGDGRLAALWLGEALGWKNPKLYEQVLDDADGRIRAAGVRALGDRLSALSAEEGFARLAKAAVDEHPRVRLEAVRVLAKLNTPEATDAALQALKLPRDRFLDYALWLTTYERGSAWLSALLDGKLPLDGREASLEFALANLPGGQGMEGLRKLMPSPLPRDGSGPWVGLAIKTADPVLLDAVYKQALWAGFDNKVTVKILGDLEATVSGRGVKLADRTAELRTMFAAEDAQVVAASLRLAGALRVAALQPDLSATAAKASTPEPIRIAALDGLSHFADSSAKEALQAVVGSASPASLKRVAALALVKNHRSDALVAIRSLLPDLQDPTEARAFWQQALSLSGLSDDLAKSFLAQPLDEKTAALNLPAVPDIDEHAGLLGALREQAGAATAPGGHSSDEIHAIAEMAAAKGDAARGELIYRRPMLACAACHALGGAGGKVGPDMTSIGASAPLDYLVESVVLPGVKVKEGYHAVVIETRDGRTIMGRLLKSGGGQTVIADSVGQEITLADDAILKRTDSGSLMPAGLTASLTEQEQADLYKFLSQLGKPGDYDATKSRAPRVWALLAATDALPAGAAEKGDASLPWMSITGTVNGRLLASEAAPMLGDAKEVFAATRIEFASSTDISLKLPANVKGAWIDGTPVKDGKATLSPGKHVIVVRYQPDGADFRYEASAGTFLPAW
ncbi:GDSL-type esterase/lipase family protein [Luteolibacter flavescens]|uniref:GDSL-type esterase/lipase family protein n=1 Tax=Luteolibacter flavescens TaxID=1859460 RepID=A0ABT3FJ39_9BACT|nr:PVC-type heme-binding CxxCH protein [Luteolibacter flavescens]MCW1883587.1 GDSL-type esterase/lipase family protein [Luteolibacter flavescens]